LLFVNPGVAQQQVPPESHPPAQSALPNSAIQKQIENKIANDPALHSVNVKVNVDESSIVLSGTVDTEQQHNLVLRAAQSFAGDRPIDDRIQVRGKT
jgi:osmotically-inducible protein OsmY